MISLALLILSGCPAPTQSIDAPTDTGTTSETGVLTDTTDQTDLGVFVTSDCGFKIGDNACNTRLLDQNGDVFDLSHQEGKVILLDSSTIWCVVCRMAAAGVQEMQDHYGTEFVYATMLYEDIDADTVEVSEAEEWADEFGINAPVLAGDISLTDYDQVTGWYNGTPAFYVIDKEQKISFFLPGWNENMVKEGVENSLND